ncbi:hypothetical protein HG15A2_46370 [Adhaeretor mobilis]|uniref:Uncharacterized protein n=1 Tax=Adhaeretor mobilis TaxID=1930276 RepID=A0A517N2E0_9BACT|nr:hypothetical protein HG15A2_46370 [Adhaeretor mobilis]
MRSVSRDTSSGMRAAYSNGLLGQVSGPLAARGLQTLHSTPAPSCAAHTDTSPLQHYEEKKRNEEKVSVLPQIMELCEKTRLPPILCP